MLISFLVSFLSFQLGAKPLTVPYIADTSFVREMVLMDYASHRFAGCGLRPTSWDVPAGGYERS